MATGSLEDDEWDAEFVEQLVQAEEQALLTQRPHHPRPLPPRQPTVPISYSRPRQQLTVSSQCSQYLKPPPLQQQPMESIGHSPPRELSQRTRETSHAGGLADGFDSSTHFSKELEIDRLKKELGRVSKQLNLMERECSELRKEKNKKEEQLKVVHSKTEKEVAEKYHAKITDSIHFVSSSTDPGISRECPNANPPNNSFGQRQNVACNSVGVQTDQLTELSIRCSEKLLGLWNSSEQKTRKGLVEKLLTTCGMDIGVLFGYMNSGISYGQRNSEIALSDQHHSTKFIETSKVSMLYSEWTKFSDGISRLEDLLEAFVDLCSLKNDVIVQRSLRVLHMILMNSFSMGKNFHKRDNVTVEEPFSANDNSEINKCGYSDNETLFSANVTLMLNQGNNPSGLGLSNAKTPCHGGFYNHDIFAESISGPYWVSLFERICQIAITSNEEKIRLEALPIMNLVLMRQNAYLERDKFVGEQLFSSLAQLLRRDAGFCVQDLAVHALYLICNCPKVLAMICSVIKDDTDCTSSSDMNKKRTVQTLNEILIGLADCVAYSGTATVEEMKLRRNAILFLAFLGSSGESGFEILVTFRLPKGTHFLSIIVQSLISDLELETTKSTQLFEVVREKSLLIREALILLNRLVSHQKYSIPALQALTSTRDMASMSVDLAIRLTHTSNFSWQDNRTKQILESEVMDLARVFKRRVFAYLGDGCR